MIYMTATRQQNFRVSGLFSEFFREMGQEVVGRDLSRHGAGKEFSEAAVVALYALGPDLLKFAHELTKRFERDPNGAAQELLRQISTQLEERDAYLADKVAAEQGGRPTPKGSPSQKGRRRGSAG